jgi:hypothetical protein
MGFAACRRKLLLGGTAIILCQGLGRPAQAYEYTFDNGVKVQIQNALQYSVLERTSPESPYLAAVEINNNDGDNNLRAGIVSNRFDLLSKLDVSYDGFGFDASADSFYDTVYNQHTQNGDGVSYNPASEPPNKFTSQTRTAAGRDIELRNLFVYGSQTIAGVPVTLRVGRLANIFGESLFFATNGIAYGNAPLDIERAESVPNTQAKDLFLPVGQVNLSAQLTDTISATAYYQFEWEKYNFSPSGSYFSTVDLEGQGAQRIIVNPPSGPGPGLYFYRGRDISGSDTGQFGLAVHYDPVDAPYDLGFYALQYNDSEPQVYSRPNFVSTPHGPVPVPTPVPGNPGALAFGTYQLVYPDHIQIYGISGSTTYGPTNIGGEVSARTNEPLVSTVTVGPGEIADNNHNPLYAIGNTLHYQASAIYLGPGSKYWDASTVLFEAAGDNLLGFTKNRENFNPAYRHMALGLRSIASLTYYSVLPGLDVTPNIGLGWNFMGLAPDTQGFNNTGIDRGGDLTVGVSAAFLVKWTGGISYTRYIAPPGRDPYADRDFAGFNIERTF